MSHTVTRSALAELSVPDQLVHIMGHCEASASKYRHCLQDLSGQHQQKTNTRFAASYCFFTSPAGAVVKYCDEYVCLCVCLSTRISPEPHARSLPNFLCKLHVSVARSSSDMFMIGCIAYRREGVFFPVDNAYASGTTRAIFTIGHIAYRQEGVFFRIKNALTAGKGGWECTAHPARVKYAIYNCLVISFYGRPM